MAAQQLATAQLGSRGAFQDPQALMPQRAQQQEHDLLQVVPAVGHPNQRQQQKQLVGYLLTSSATCC
jgi:hypothetical protein